MNPQQVQYEQPVQNAQNKLIMSKAKEMGMDCKPLIPSNQDFLELSYKRESIIINKTRSHKMTLMSGLLAKNKETSKLLSEIVTDRTAQICWINTPVAIEAAKALQVDVAGLDIRCKDIGVPLDDMNGGVIEVNDLPDRIDPHLFFQRGSSDALKMYLQ